MGQLWKIAVIQLLYEVGTGRDRWELVSRLINEADDAQQCARDLGIIPQETELGQLTELERVGLGGLLDAAACAPKSLLRTLGPQ